MSFSQRMKRDSQQHVDDTIDLFKRRFPSLLDRFKLMREVTEYLWAPCGAPTPEWTLLRRLQRLQAHRQAQLPLRSRMAGLIFDDSGFNYVAT